MTWGGKKAFTQQQVTLPTICIFTLQLRSAIAGQMYQSCCLGYSQHRQEGGISSRCPSKKALVTFTNLLIEAKRNDSHSLEKLPNCRQQKRWPSVPCLGHSMRPTTSLAWGNPKPRLLEKADASSPSGSAATLPRDPAASSEQPHPAIRSLCPQVPLRNPNHSQFRDFPRWVWFLCAYNLWVYAVGHVRTPQGLLCSWHRMAGVGQCKFD